MGEEWEAGGKNLSLTSSNSLDRVLCGMLLQPGGLCGLRQVWEDETKEET